LTLEAFFFLFGGGVVWYVGALLTNVGSDVDNKTANSWWFLIGFAVMFGGFAISLWGLSNLN